MAGNWLAGEIRKVREADEANVQDSSELELPRRDGKAYEINDCEEDQKEIVAYVLRKLRGLVNPAYCHRLDGDEDCHLTICGVAGSGKSVLIQTVVTAIRRVTGVTGTVLVFGPTGSAAFNVGGETVHHGFRIPQVFGKEGLDGDKLKCLLHKFRNIVGIIIDERSMIDATVLGAVEQYCRQFANNQRMKSKSWGGIPIVMLVGDDYQLPSVEPGALYAMPDGRPASDKQNPIKQKFREVGFNEFLRLGERVMCLKGSKRVNKKQEFMTRILEGVRGEEVIENGVEFLKDISVEDAEKLMMLHRDDKRFSSEDWAEIEEDALYLFATKDPRNDHNRRKLRNLNRRGYKVARIKAVTRLYGGGLVVRNDHHYDPDRNPPYTLICILSKVQLTGWNGYPLWGLYHGAFGTVIDIVFEEGHSPNEDDLPVYVLCDFPQYRGPEFIKGKPTYVPIYPVETPCTKRPFCCMRKSIPLTLAYGKTGHSFQGQTVGPVDAGRPENIIKRVIIDPGTKRFEGNNPGLLYTMLARGTTLGTFDDKFSSAIYFDGTNMNSWRVRSVTKGAKNQFYEKVRRRRIFVRYLKEHEMPDCGLTASERTELFEWARTCQVTNTGREEMFNRLSSI